MGIEAARLTDASAKAEEARVVTTQPWANCCIQVPVCETAWPLHNRVNCRFRSAPRRFRGGPVVGDSGASAAAGARCESSVVTIEGSSSRRTSVLRGASRIHLLFCRRRLQKLVAGSYAFAGANSPA